MYTSTLFDIRVVSSLNWIFLSKGIIRGGLICSIIRLAKVQFTVQPQSSYMTIGFALTLFRITFASVKSAITLTLSRITFASVKSAFTLTLSRITFASVK